MKVRILGAGVAGLVLASDLAALGARIEVVERSATLGVEACAWCAGGMLAPWCEGESAEAFVVEQGIKALDWWREHSPSYVQNGTLVLAGHRDRGELTRFARMSQHHQTCDDREVAALEPDLAGRFEAGLYFPEEARVDPRLALQQLADRLVAGGHSLQFGHAMTPDEAGKDVDLVFDCRGFAARDRVSGLRGVRGEMLIVRCPGVTLTRTVRLLHPRWPLYIVPRAEHVFMLGATMIESDHAGPVTLRSAGEMIEAAQALHPAFNESEILELRADVRPAFADNLPRVERRGKIISINGLYRHGFLLSPWCASEAVRLAGLGATAAPVSELVA